VGGAPEFNAIMGCYKAIMEQDTCTKDAAFRTPETAPLISQAGDLLRRSKTSAKRVKVDRPSRGLTPPGFAFTLPLRETADAKVRLYFSAFESTYVWPVLSIPQSSSLSSLF
jgi:hypothetical protein